MNRMAVRTMFAATVWALTCSEAAAVNLGAFSGSDGPGNQTLLINNSITVTSVDSGWYTDQGEHFTDNQNYIIHDWIILAPGRLRSSYFTFDLTGLDLPEVTSAVLSIQNFQIYGPVEVAFKEVSATPEMLDTNRPNPDEVGRQIFADLQGGPTYAQTTLQTGIGGTTVLTLSADALSALNSGKPAFSIGASVATAYVPEPSTWALMILGFGATGAALRRRQLA